MIRFTIIQDTDGRFIVQAADELNRSRISPRFETIGQADDWIVEQGRGTEYTVSRNGA